MNFHQSFEKCSILTSDIIIFSKTLYFGFDFPLFIVVKMSQLELIIITKYTCIEKIYKFCIKYEYLNVLQISCQYY